MNIMRLDQYIAQEYGFSRNRVQQLIEAGLVSVDWLPICRSSVKVQENANICIQDDQRIHWVSRSAGKLAYFLERHEEIFVSWARCLDVGASTGGFTQILLQHGALHVDAVDVGTAQLHDTLRRDPRVSSYEQMDIRHFPSTVPYDVIVCDASFIALQEIFPAIMEHATFHTELILLYKPQFEVGRENLRKTGVPKSDIVVSRMQKHFENFLWEKKVQILVREKSQVQGEAGNQEWLYFVKKDPE